MRHTTHAHLRRVPDSLARVQGVTWADKSAVEIIVHLGAGGAAGRDGADQLSLRSAYSRWDGPRPSGRSRLARPIAAPASGGGVPKATRTISTFYIAMQM